MSGPNGDSTIATTAQYANCPLRRPSHNPSTASPPAEMRDFSKLWILIFFFFFVIMI